MDEKCENCRFFKPGELDESKHKFDTPYSEDLPWCRRNPSWINQSDNHWCGEYQPKHKPGYKKVGEE